MNEQQWSFEDSSAEDEPFTVDATSITDCGPEQSSIASSGPDGPHGDGSTDDELHAVLELCGWDGESGFADAERFFEDGPELPGRAVYKRQILWRIFGGGLMKKTFKFTRETHIQRDRPTFSYSGPFESGSGMGRPAQGPNGEIAGYIFAGFMAAVLVVAVIFFVIDTVGRARQQPAQVAGP
ncbi:MAG TPA: hypothetical protein VGI40_25305 [Pirellulaceae bacterium]|jgi:hypothetical protein